LTPAEGSRDASTFARAAALGALALAIVLVVVLLLRGDGGTTYKLRFQNAGQLVKGDDVQIGGRRVGSVDKIELTSDNEAQISVTVIPEFAPLHEGTSAVIRATSLSGIANRYISLTPGPNSKPKLKSGALLRADKTTAPVDLDQLFNTLDPKTRAGLTNVVKGFATQYAGQEVNANLSARFFAPALSTTQRLVNELTRDQPALTRFLVDSSKLVTDVASRRDDLAALVGNANSTAAAIGQENVSLDRAIAILPSTLRRANTTFVNLRATVDDLDVLVNASKPATKDLARFLRDLRPLVQDARPTIADLRRLVGTPGPNNDLTDATKKLPHLQRVASPTFKNSVSSLRNSQSVIDFIRPYIPDLEGWFRDFGNGASNYDANGHFARIQPIANTFSFANNVLTPIPRSLNLAGYQTGVFRRCPGGATQKTADGSAPYVDPNSGDCDPSLALPGP
jgi:phospholipid/cholesterol/gamma-HCH transport system substrate-binding protein